MITSTYQLETTFRASENASSATIIEGLKLNALNAFFANTDPAVIANREVSTSVVLSTMRMEKFIDCDFWISLVEIKLEYVERIAVDWWQDDDEIEAAANWSAAQKVGAW